MSERRRPFIFGAAVGIASTLALGLVGNIIWTFTEAPFQRIVRWASVTGDHERAYRQGLKELVDADAMLKRGDHVQLKEKYDQAVKLLTLAAENGVAEAKLALGVLYCAGRTGFVQKNAGKGQFLLVEAAEAGLKLASQFECRACAA